MHALVAVRVQQYGIPVVVPLTGQRSVEPDLSRIAALLPQEIVQRRGWGGAQCRRAADWMAISSSKRLMLSSSAPVGGSFLCRHSSA